MAGGAMTASTGMDVLTRGQLLRRLGAALAVLALAVAAAMVIGPHLLAPRDVLDAVLAGDDTSSTGIILFELRLPRIVLALSAGAALATAGAVFQALLRNPLAEPYILGISNGCVVGTIVGYLLGVGPFVQPLMAFAGGVIVVALVLAIGRGSFGLRSESMLLGGVMMGAIGAALIFLLLHLIGPQLRSAIQWMLGDLSTATATVGYVSGSLFVALLIGSFFVGDTLNALSLGDDEAASLGIDVQRVRAIAYVVGSFCVGVTVAFCGAIGFVGLVVPHIVRKLIGPDHRGLIPLSVVAGALFLLICDTTARSIMPAIDTTASELPVGAVTALVGAPLFIYLLRRGIARGEG